MLAGVQSKTGRVDMLSLFRPLLGSLVIAALCLSAGCGERGPLDGLPKGETARVVRIIDGDALVLDTGLSVRLVGLEAPAPERRDREGEPFAEQATRMLEDLALGRQVRLYYPGLTRDRYDRALAYVVTADDLGPVFWLNQEMARRGGARVRVYPDTAARGEHLFAAERLARVEAVGLWGEAVYRILPSQEMESDVRGFRIIRANGLNPVVSSEPRYACSLKTADSAFWIDVGPAASDICAAPPTGALVRGYVRDGRLELTHGLNIEPLLQ